MYGVNAWLVAGVSLVAMLAPTDGVIPQAQWALDSRHLGAEEVWRHSKGEGIIVAVIDSGVDAAAPELMDRILPGAGFVGISDDIGHTDLSPDSHGTAVAGIIAGTGAGDKSASMFGLAPAAKILPIRTSIDGYSQPISLAKGMFFAVDHGARIITVSSGTTAPDPNIRAAVDYATKHGVIVVAAAGNLGRQGNPPYYPAALSGVVSVTGVDSAGEFWADSESGPTTVLAAPATGIYTTSAGGKHIFGDGTSYAAPFVAASAAVVWSANPQFSPTQVVDRLTGTADQHGKGRDDRYGYGVVNPLRALTGPAPAAPAVSGTRFPWPVVSGGAALVLAAGLAFVWWRRRNRT